MSSSSSPARPIKSGVSYLIVAGILWNVWIAAGPAQALRGIFIIAVYEFLLFVFAVIVVGVRGSLILDLIHCLFWEQSTWYKAGTGGSED